MKFLLAAVNAKYIHSNPAIYSLRAYAGEELQQYIELAEYTINQSMQEILSDIYVRKPDIIGFSCYIWNWRLVQELIGELPKLLPDALLWLGGPEVTYDAEKILQQYPQLTGIMVGEGEAVFRELLQYYVKEYAEAGIDFGQCRCDSKVIDAHAVKDGSINEDHTGESYIKKGDRRDESLDEINIRE